MRRHTKQRLVYGWGINDADYVVQPTINGKQVWCPFYRTWCGMIERCHSTKWRKRRPTYVDCKITSGWKYFMNFRAWMETQDWENKQLDKDFLGEKLYSSETCCFVEPWLNSLFTDRAAARGKWPIGVSKKHNKFCTHLSINGKRAYIGYFDTPQEAHQAYRLAKIKHVENLMKNYPNQRIKQAVLAKLILPVGK